MFVLFSFSRRVLMAKQENVEEMYAARTNDATSFRQALTISNVLDLANHTWLFTDMKSLISALLSCLAYGLLDATFWLEHFFIAKAILIFPIALDLSWVGRSGKKFKKQKWRRSDDGERKTKWWMA